MSTGAAADFLSVSFSGLTRRNTDIDPVVSVALLRPDALLNKSACFKCPLPAAPSSVSSASRDALAEVAPSSSSWIDATSLNRSFLFGSVDTGGEGGHTIGLQVNAIEYRRMQFADYRVTVTHAGEENRATGITAAICIARVST
jgi:hypothetical protein